MKLISWNVNGLRSVMQKGFLDFLKEHQPDVLCLQETKSMKDQLQYDFEDYVEHWNSAQKKGYSGTMTMSRQEPLSVTMGMGAEIFDREGRVLTVEWEDFYLVNVYSPNSKRELLRLEERMVFEKQFRLFLQELNKKKGVIVCGDLNVAHQEIDLKNPESNRRNAGFTDEEREQFTVLLEFGFVDSFRYLYPDQRDCYSWWSYITRARERNAGWRIDYFLVSDDMKDRIQEAGILSDVMGSDHAPVFLELNERSI